MTTAPEFYSNDTLSANPNPQALNPIEESHHKGEDVEISDMTPQSHEVNIDKSNTPEGLSRLPEQEQKDTAKDSSETLCSSACEYAKKLETDLGPLFEARDNNFEETDATGKTTVNTATLRNFCERTFGLSNGDSGEKITERVDRLAKALVKDNLDSLKWIIHEFDPTLAASVTDPNKQIKLLSKLLSDSILLTAATGPKTQVASLMRDLAEGKISWRYEERRDNKVPAHTRRLIASMAELSNNEYTSGSTKSTLGIRKEFVLGAIWGNRGLDGEPPKTGISGKIGQGKIKEAFEYAKDPGTQSALGITHNDTTFCIYSAFIENGAFQGVHGTKQNEVALGQESEQRGSHIVKVDDWRPTSNKNESYSKDMYKGLYKELKIYEDKTKLQDIQKKFEENANLEDIGSFITTVYNMAEAGKMTNKREGYKILQSIDKNDLAYISTELQERISAHTDITDPRMKEVILRDYLREIKDSVDSFTDDADKLTPWNTLWKTEVFMAQEALKGGDTSKSLELLGKLAIFSKDNIASAKALEAIKTITIADLISNNNGGENLHNIVLDPSRGLEEIATYLRGLPDGDLLRERADLLFDRIKNIEDFRALSIKPDRTPEEEQKLNSLISLIRDNGNNVFQDNVDLGDHRSIYEASSESDLKDLDFVEKLQLNAIKTVLGAKSDEEAREILALNNEGQILQNHGKRWMNIFNKFKGRAAVLALGAGSTLLAVTSPALAPIAGAVGLGLLGIQAVNTGIRIAKNAKSFVEKSGGIKNAIKNIWGGIKTSAREAWISVKENPVEFLIGGIIPTAIRVGVNVLAPGWGRIAGAGTEVGMGIIAEAKLGGKKRELAEKLTALRGLTEGFNPQNIEITDASGATRTISIKPGMAYREYIEQKAKLRIGLNNGDITLTNPTTGDPITWDEIKENEDEIFKHVQSKYPPTSDQDYARNKVIENTLKKSKEIKTIEDKYLKGVAKWNSALAGAAVFGIIDRITNFTERASDAIRQPAANDINGPITEDPTEGIQEDPTPPQNNDQFSGEQQPASELPREGILVQDGRVNLEGSAWNQNRGRQSIGSLPGGAANHSNYSGGITEMSSFLLENDLQDLGITRSNLLDNLEVSDVHQLLNIYVNAISSGNTDPNLVEILKGMGEKGQSLLATVNN